MHQLSNFFSVEMMTFITSIPIAQGDWSGQLSWEHTSLPRVFLFYLMLMFQLIFILLQPLLILNVFGNSIFPLEINYFVGNFFGIDCHLKHSQCSMVSFLYIFNFVTYALNRWKIAHMLYFFAHLLRLAGSFSLACAD